MRKIVIKKIIDRLSIAKKSDNNKQKKRTNTQGTQTKQKKQRQYAIGVKKGTQILLDI